MSNAHAITAYRLCCQARLAERAGNHYQAASLYQTAAAQFSAAGKREQSAQCYTHANRCRYNAGNGPERAEPVRPLAAETTDA
jgi:hypothetical protein